MLGFNSLGYMGRFGNQMFQFSALKGIARNRGFEYCIPPSQEKTQQSDSKTYYENNSKGKSGHQLFNAFKLKNTTQLNVQYIDNSRPTVQESSSSFDENLFNNCSDWINLAGYFQTEKYFKHIRQELLGDFEFRDEILVPCKEMMESIDDPISLHIRRTDYFTSPNHTVISLDYYKKALKKFDSKRTVIIFSDDTEWCNQQSIFDDDRFIISENNSNYVDMCLMSLCTGHIIANSSFSWWGAWLSNSERVIAPSGWYSGSNSEHLDTSDLYCSNWEII